MKIFVFLAFIVSSVFSRPPLDYPIEYPINVNRVDKAIIQVLDSINPFSIKFDIEHGGMAYVRPYDTGNFDIFVSPVQTDSLPHNITIKPDTNRLNNGFVKVADYHTHAGPNPYGEDEIFSDIDTAKSYFKRYLATPQGKILKFDPFYNKVLILNRKKMIWEIYNYIPPVFSDSIPISPKLRLYDRIHPSILGQ